MREEIFRLVNEERERQDLKWGAIPRRLPMYTWLTVLVEEVGEVAKAVLQKDWEGFKEETIQVIAVCVAWLEDVYYE